MPSLNLFNARLTDLRITFKQRQPNLKEKLEEKDDLMNFEEYKSFIS